MSWNIIVSYRGQPFRLKVEEVYAGDTVYRFEVSASEKTFLLERRSLEKVFEKRWKIKSVNWEFKDQKVAAEFIYLVMQHLDDDIDGKKNYSRYKE